MVRPTSLGPGRPPPPRLLLSAGLLLLLLLPGALGRGHARGPAGPGRGDARGARGAARTAAGDGGAAARYGARISPLLRAQHDDDTLLLASAGAGAEKDKDKDDDDEDKKTLSQQVAEGKYGLIQKELFATPPRRPGVLSYAANPEVPGDTAANLGGLDEEEIWLAEDHLLVLRGGAFRDKPGQQEPWPPIDDYHAPPRQVKLPANPRVPPPFPVQLTDHGPTQFLTSANGTPPFLQQGFVPLVPFNGTLLVPPFPLPPGLGLPPGLPPGQVGPPGGFLVPLPFPPPNASLSLLQSLPPGAAFLPPPLPTNLSEPIDEDDPSIYYPPPYDFYYPKDNSSAVPAGPLVPGIILPPPPDFFAPLEPASSPPTSTEPPPTRPPTRPRMRRPPSKFRPSLPFPAHPENEVDAPRPTLPPEHLDHYQGDYEGYDYRRPKQQQHDVFQTVKLQQHVKVQSGEDEEATTERTVLIGGRRPASTTPRPFTHVTVRKRIRPARPTPSPAPPPSDLYNNLVAPTAPPAAESPASQPIYQFDFTSQRAPERAPEQAPESEAYPDHTYAPTAQSAPQPESTPQPVTPESVTQAPVVTQLPIRVYAEQPTTPAPAPEEPVTAVPVYQGDAYLQPVSQAPYRPFYKPNSQYHEELVPIRQYQQEHPVTRVHPYEQQVTAAPVRHYQQEPIRVYQQEQHNIQQYQQEVQPVRQYQQEHVPLRTYAQTVTSIPFRQYQEEHTATPVPVRTYQQEHPVTLSSVRHYPQEQSVTPVPIRTYQQEHTVTAVPVRHYQQEQPVTSGPIRTYQQEHAVTQLPIRHYRPEHPVTQQPLRQYQQEHPVTQQPLRQYQQEHPVTQQPLRQYQQEHPVTQQPLRQYQQEHPVTQQPLRHYQQEQQITQQPLRHYQQEHRVTQQPLRHYQQEHQVTQQPLRHYQQEHQVTQLPVRQYQQEVSSIRPYQQEHPTATPASLRPYHPTKAPRVKAVTVFPTTTPKPVRYYPPKDDKATFYFYEEPVVTPQQHQASVSTSKPQLVYETTTVIPHAAHPHSYYYVPVNKTLDYYNEDVYFQPQPPRYVYLNDYQAYQSTPPPAAYYPPKSALQYFNGDPKPASAIGPSAGAAKTPVFEFSFQAQSVQEPLPPRLQGGFKPSNRLPVGVPVGLAYATTPKPTSTVYTTSNPLYYYTQQDDSVFDDITKKYFSMFGRKLPHQHAASQGVEEDAGGVAAEDDVSKAPLPLAPVRVTTPLPPSSTPRPFQHHQPEPEGGFVPIVSLADDTLVNYRRPLPALEPDAEIIEQPATPGPAGHGHAPGNAFISYQLPGNGGHFYFLTPQRAQHPGQQRQHRRRAPRGERERDRRKRRERRERSDHRDR